MTNDRSEPGYEVSVPGMNKQTVEAFESGRFTSIGKGLDCITCGSTVSIDGVATHHWWHQALVPGSDPGPRPAWGAT